MADDELLGIILIAIGAAVLILIGLPLLIFSIMAQSILGDIPGFGWAIPLAGIVLTAIGAIMIVAGVVFFTRAVKVGRGSPTSYRSSPGPCPNCGRWMGSEGPFCPYCGLKRV